MAYLIDGRAVDWHLKSVLENLFQTFWGKFGWGHVLLAHHISYSIIGLFTFIGIASAFTWLMMRILQSRTTSPGKLLPWEILFLFLTVIGYYWIGALTRGAPYLPLAQLYIPVARYAYPSIIPTITVLAIGWLFIMRSCMRLFIREKRNAEMVALVIYIGFWVVLDVYAFWSISSYYT